MLPYGPSGAFLDFGAATGVDAAFYAFARRSARQRVVSVEWAPEKIPRLRRRYAGLANVSLLHTALPGTQSSNYTGRSSCGRIAKEFGAVGYAKVDVEASTSFVSAL